MKKPDIVAWILAKSELAVHGENASHVVNNKIEDLAKQGNSEKVNLWIRVAQSIETIRERKKAGTPN